MDDLPKDPKIAGLSAVPTSEETNMLISRVIAVAMASCVLVAPSVYGYPPAVGILADHRSCNSCHIDNGSWTDEDRTIIDVLDAKTKASLKREDGSFLIEVDRGEKFTVLTVIGRKKEDASPPTRNAWLYVDPAQIKTSALSKFAPGWDVNLPMACRVVGDKIDRYEGSDITVLPMTIRPGDAARNSELELQIMLTSGASIKGSATKGLISNYVMRKVYLQVSDD
jgi:hypothetical protein